MSGEPDGLADLLLDDSWLVEILFGSDEHLAEDRLAGLLEELAVELAPPDRGLVVPTAAELDALRRVVAAHFGAAWPPPPGPVRPRRAGPMIRVGAVAAVLVVGSTSAAAAATGQGLHLPRPARAVAYAVGLPVDSPALDDTHRHLRALDHAIHVADQIQAAEAARRVRQALARVPGNERAGAEVEVARALAAAAPLLGHEPEARAPQRRPAGSTGPVGHRPGGVEPGIGGQPPERLGGRLGG